jgi:Asp-tRNA(Asn)/Glu-tRNA(Gln) amidotransferase A subunit family amidase
VRATVAPTLGSAIVHPEVVSIVEDAAAALIEAAGLARTDVVVDLPEDGIAWARAGLPGLIVDLEDHWPDCADDLTFEIRVGMEFSKFYRAKHAAAIELFRVQMVEAMADVFERTDVVLCAVSPFEPFNAEGPMPTTVGEVKASPWNGGALTIPANIAGYPAISIPAGLSASGLPIGLQAYARRGEEALLLDLAAIMERERPWPLTAPGAPA